MRRSVEETPATDEHIEMSHFENECDLDDYEKYEHGTILRRPAKGHDFQVHCPEWN